MSREEEVLLRIGNIHFATHIIAFTYTLYIGDKVHWMTAIINHRLYHYYESDEIKIGRVFKIFEAEFQDGLLLLVKPKNCYTTDNYIFVFKHFQLNIKVEGELTDMPNLIPVGLPITTQRRSYSTEEQCKLSILMS